jgi:hypothetical protein
MTESTAETETESRSTWLGRFTLAAGKAAVGTLVAATGDIVAPILWEIASELLPRHREKNLGRFEEKLKAKLAPRDLREAIVDAAQDPAFAATLTDAMRDAAGAGSEERVDHLASVLASGLRADVVDTMRMDTILRILRELSDPEVILLYYLSAQWDQGFQQRHQAVLYPSSSAERTDTEAHRQGHVVRRAHREQLERLGLLNSSGTANEVGQLLLRHIGWDPSPKATWENEKS